MWLECSFISIYYFDDTKDSKYNSNLIYIFSVTNSVANPGKDIQTANN